MEWLRKFSKGLGVLFRKRRDEQELDDEIRAYVEAAAEKRMQAGNGREEAYRAARSELGSVAAVKDYVRDAGWETWLENLFGDLRYALRMLWRNPSFSAVVIVILALGIGANTALFSLVNAALLKSLPVRDPDQLVLLSFVADAAKEPYLGYDGNDSEKGGEIEGTSFLYSTFEQLREHHEGLSAVAGFARIEQLDVVVSGHAEIASGQYVSGNYYAMLGVPAGRGRLFTDADDNPGAPAGAVITWQYWQRRFGGDPRAIGMAVTIDNLPFTIIGVTPPGFVGTGQMGQPADVSIPLALEALLDAPRPMLRQPAEWWVILMGRLLPGITREQAQARLTPTFQQSTTESLKLASVGWKNKPTTLGAADYPGVHVGPGAQGEMNARSRYRLPLIVLTIVVGLVLLIACINVASLLLARSAARQQEIAMRFALGARRSRVVRQLLTESLLLSSIAGGMGLLLAYWGKALLAGWAPWGNGKITPPVDERVLEFTLALTVLTGILFGIAPALRSTSSAFVSGLKRTSGATARSRKSLTGSTLLAAQVAISLVLVIAAGLFLRTLHNLNSVNLGFDRDNLLLFRVKPQTNGYDAPRTEQLYGRMLERLRAAPGVRGVALSRHPLLAQSQRASTIVIQGKTKEGDSVQVNIVSPSFFATMRIPVLAGRSLSENDTGASPKVAVVNEMFVRKYFPGESPVGQRFSLPRGVRGQPGFQEVDWQIVGVSSDTKYTDVRSEVHPTIFQSYRQEPTLQSNFEVRFSGDEGVAAQAIRDAVHDVDASLPIFDVRTQIEQADESTAQERLFARLSSSMSLLALLLAAIGLYGTMSYAVVRRTQEIGIRMALGAQQGDVLWMVLRETLMLVLVGVVVGVPLALSASHAARSVMASLLFGVKANDPATMVIAVLVLGGVALLAGLLPAWRAAKTDPMVALRAE